MIAQLKGQIVASDLTYLVLDVMGVGYQVFASGRSLSQLGGIGSEVTVARRFEYLKTRSLASSTRQ